MLPFAPFLSLQQYKGDLDNIQWELDIEWIINENQNLYGSFLMDEWDPSMTFDKPNRNWFGYQIGTEITNSIIAKIILDWSIIGQITEFIDINSINDYYSHG